MAGTLKLGISIDLSQMRAAIRAASQALQGFAEAARRVGAQLGTGLFGAATSAAKSFASTMQNSLGGIARAVGVASAALGGLGTGLSLAGATRTIADFDQAIASLGAISGASKEDMARLSEEARRLGATTRYTAGEATQAMIYAAQQGYNANQILASAGGFLNMAMAGGLNLADAALIGTSALAGFGLAADQAARVADVMAQAANSSGTNVQQLGEAFKFAAAPAAALGVSIEEATAVLGIMANSSIRAEMGGTSLRAMLLRLGSGIAPVRKALDSIGLTMADVSLDTNSFVQVLEKLDAATRTLSNSDRVQVFNQMFGVQRATGALIAVRDVEQIKELQAKLEAAAGQAAVTAATMNNTLIGAWKNLQSSAEELALKMGDGGFKGAMMRATDAVTGFLKALGQTGMVQAFGAAIGQLIDQGKEFSASLTGLFGQIDWGKGFLDGMLEVIKPVAHILELQVRIALKNAVNAMIEGMRGVARVFGDDIARVIETIASHLLNLNDKILERMKATFLNLAKIPGFGGFGRAQADQVDKDRASLREGVQKLGPNLRATLAKFGATSGQLLSTASEEVQLAIIQGAMALPGKAVSDFVASLQPAPSSPKRDAKSDPEMAAAQRAEEEGTDGAVPTSRLGQVEGSLAAPFPPSVGWAGSLASTVNWLFGRNPADHIAERIGNEQIGLLKQLVKNTSGPQVVTVEGVFD